MGGESDRRRKTGGREECPRRSDGGRGKGKESGRDKEPSHSNWKSMELEWTLLKGGSCYLVNGCV